MKFQFEVKGSAPEPYNVRIERNGDNLTAYCDCPAGSNGMYCKHRFGLFRGLDKDVVGGDVDRIGDIPDLLVGTDVEEAMIALEQVEAEAAEIKKRLSAAKKAVAKAMHN